MTARRCGYPRRLTKRDGHTRLQQVSQNRILLTYSLRCVESIGLKGVESNKYVSLLLMPADMILNTQKEQTCWLRRTVTFAEQNNAVRPRSNKTLQHLLSFKHLSSPMHFTKCLRLRSKVAACVKAFLSATYYIAMPHYVPKTPGISPDLGPYI